MKILNYTVSSPEGNSYCCLERSTKGPRFKVSFKRQSPEIDKQIRSPITMLNSTVDCTSLPIFHTLERPREDLDAKITKMRNPRTSGKALKQSTLNFIFYNIFDCTSPRKEISACVETGGELRFSL